MGKESDQDAENVHAKSAQWESAYEWCGQKRPRVCIVPGTIQREVDSKS